MNGNSASEGRVEVYYGGVYGTVCQEGGWSLVEANVACRQLGYARAEMAALNSMFGSGSGQVTYMWEGGRGGCECYGK